MAGVRNSALKSAMDMVSSLDVTAKVTSRCLSMVTSTPCSVASCVVVVPANSLASKVAGLRMVILLPTPGTKSPL